MTCCEIHRMKERAKYDPGDSLLRLHWLAVMQVSLMIQHYMRGTNIGLD